MVALPHMAASCKTLKVSLPGSIHPVRYATNMTKANTSKNGRDSIAKRLGVKKFGGEAISVGEIILRQRGTKWHPGENVKRGSDDTIYSLIDGYVKFSSDYTKKRTYVHVEPKFQPHPRQFFLRPMYIGASPSSINNDDWTKCAMPCRLYTDGQPVFAHTTKQMRTLHMATSLAQQ